METINDWVYLINKIDFDTHIEGNDDEMFNYNKTMLKDEFEEFNSEKIKTMLNIVDGFANFSITITIDCLG